MRNTNTNEIHDTQNEQDRCNLDQILDEHAEWYDDKLQAMMSTRDANPCHWCMVEKVKEKYQPSARARIARRKSVDNEKYGLGPDNIIGPLPPEPPR